ncbi:hypothetical protein BDV97DRAFT_370938 [Delphinella strobiligena]|nr:hypothetical protein BDV97DRAFT_370938 [Delphinella strobiligena]
MRNLARSHSASQEQSQSGGDSLLFRNVALLYPWKQVLERIRREGNVDATLPHCIHPMFDEDDDKESPLADKQDIRVLIAQDDTGMSLDRLLFDSKLAHDTKHVDADLSKHAQSILSFNRSSIAPESPRSSAFARNQPSKLTQTRPYTQPRVDGTSTPSESSAFFGQASHIRRLPTYVSLADARNDPQVPIEDTKDEMDSWLDCVFGKSQMRYKGDNTKMHVLQQQPLDPKQAHWEKESQRGASDLCSERKASSPRSRPDELVKLRKPILLISRTFNLPIHDEDLSEHCGQKINPHPTAKMANSNSTRDMPQLHCTTPTFAVSIVLPIAKTSNGDEHDTIQIESVTDHWHTIGRALDALEASAALYIQRKLAQEVEAVSHQYTNRPPTALRVVRLKPGALQESGHIIQLSHFISARIARAFRIIHVESRNGWNIWRDELRDSGMSGKGLDAIRVAFIQLAITAALSSSLSWMRIFAPPQLQMRLQREARELEDTYDGVQNRTIIVTADHNKARQVIYILSKFVPVAQPPAQFQRSPTSIRPPAHISALTQGLKAVSQGPDDPKVENRGGRTLGVTFGAAPTFSLPTRPSPSTSPVKSESMMSVSKSASPGKSSNLYRMKSRIDVQGKSTPAMAIASAPSSEYTTPAVSPETRPNSSASAASVQEDLLRHLQRNNSAMSETSTESGSFWNSLRSTSWNWGFRRESTATSGSEGVGTSAPQRGDAPTGILKTGRTSFGRTSSRKLVRMVEEAEEVHAPHGECSRRTDSAIPSPTLQTLASGGHDPIQFSQLLEYTYDAAESVVDVQLLGEKPASRSCKVPVSNDCFPLIGDGEVPVTNVSPSRSDENYASYDRVAGYLERVHPDFVLQAVKPHKSLIDDIKKCMQGERSPKQDIPIADQRFFPSERWVEVCSTVIVDSDAMMVKRLTLRRRVRYSLTTTGDHSSVTDPAPSGIKITKSDDMDTVKRTYRRNDIGNKVDWKDKKVVASDHGSSSGSGENSLTSSYDHLDVGSSSTVKQLNGLKSAGSRQFDKKSRSASDNQSDSSETQPQHAKIIGDDLTPFIDENAKNNHKAKMQPPPAPARRVAIRNDEGKITGWKDAIVGEQEERGLRDLPASFLSPRHEELTPAIHERTLEEVFEEEIITKPEPAIINLLEQMLASNETRSAGPSRAGSVHGRTHSRSNSISGSGLTELQFESKKIVEDVLEGLVASVATDKPHSPFRPSGGFLGSFRRGLQSPTETSILRQSISKWLNEG